MKAVIISHVRGFWKVHGLDRSLSAGEPVHGRVHRGKSALAQGLLPVEAVGFLQLTSSGRSDRHLPQLIELELWADLKK
jgi:hypothetical protein